MSTESHGERRRHPRTSLKMAATVRTSLGAKQQVKISELSEGGCSVVTSNGVASASGYSVKLEGLESLSSDLRWKAGNLAGFEFERPLHPAVFDHLVANHPPEPEGD